MPGGRTGAVALPVPSASPPGSNHNQETIGKQFWHYPPCGILLCNPYYHCGVQYHCWHKPECQVIFGRESRVCEQQATLTNAPQLEMVLLMPFSSCHDPAAFGPKATSVQRKGVAFMTPHHSQEFRRMCLGVNILSLWEYESILEGKDGF